jgi:ABC-2 type transport system permease protein
MKFLIIAKWEFLEKIRSKAFLVSLVLFPVIMVTFGVLPGLLATKADDKTISVGVLDESGRVLSPLCQKLDERYRLPNGEPNYKVRDLADVSGDERFRSAANALVSAGEIEGYFVIPPSILDSGLVEYRAENVGNIRLIERFTRTLEEVITERRLLAKGFAADLIRKLNASVEIRSFKVSEGGAERESGFLETFFGAYIFIMMLMFMVLTSGQLLIRSVVEEKSNRVIEVLLSSCSPRDLMVGKILGLSGLGLFQISIWGLIAAGLALRFDAGFIVTENLGLMLVYFVLGYLLYAGIFVAAGAPVTTEQEAQQITSYISLLLVFPTVLALPAMQNPDSTLIHVLSFIPLVTPAFMLLRISIQMPPAWEVWSTIGLLLVSIVVSMWMAGKIFRTAILAYGKRLTIAELIRLLAA